MSLIFFALLTFVIRNFFLSQFPSVNSGHERFQAVGGQHGHGQAHQPAPGPTARERSLYDGYDGLKKNIIGENNI